MIDKYNLDKIAWKDLLPKVLCQYNYEKKQRAVGKTPIEVTDRDKELFTSHKYAQTVNIQHWWAAKVNGQTQGLCPNNIDENQKDLGRCTYSLPILLDRPTALEQPLYNTGLLKKKRLLPHNCQLEINVNVQGV